VSFFLLVFKDAGIDLSKPITSMCNSGMSSCSLALAADLCGCPDVGVFFVSTSFVYIYIRC
jgi:3-mercaptopyruvate sulfurtransferase SseA